MSTPPISRPNILGGVKHAALVLLCFTALYLVFFSPVLLAGKLIASGDAVIYYLPNLLLPKIAWDPLVMSGAPSLADPQVMAWYPLATLFYWLQSYNGFLISAYVLASCFSYGYVYSLTRSRLAGTVSGITYGLCGFMFAHLGHTSIVHAAAWLPLIFWALESLRERFSAIWLAIGSFAVACCFLAGHPQVFVYSTFLSGAYILTQGWNAPRGRFRYYLSACLMMGIGVGLTAIQMLPTLELARLTVREKLPFATFVSYAIPLEQIPMLLFPNLFGGTNLPGGTLPYFGKWNEAELTGYVGLLPLTLAALGAFSGSRKRLVIFWVSAGVLAFLLALGAETPLGQITYRIPAINKFRCPARHLIELALATSFLSGLGVGAIVRREVSLRKLAIAIGLTGGGVVICLSGLVLFRSTLLKFLTANGTGVINLKPWQNPALGIPVVIFLASSAALIYWFRKPESRHRFILVLVILILDLSSFSWFSYWQRSPFTIGDLKAPVTAQQFGAAARADLQRLMPMRGATGTFEEVMPNISRLWNVPSVSGHGVFALTKYCELTSMRTDGGGAFDADALPSENQALNLIGVRYLFLPRPSSTTGEKPRRFGSTTVNWFKSPGVNWPAADIDLTLGSTCGALSTGPAEVALQEPFTASKIGIVSWLGCATEIEDGTPVAELTVTDVAGKKTTLELVAGRDTSEWSYDCAETRAQSKHSRANILSSFPADVANSSCQGHRYVAMLPLPQNTKVQSVAVRWLTHPGVLVVRNLGLINEQSQEGYFLKPSLEPVLDESRWRHVEDHGATSVYENLMAFPRVWLVPEVVSLSSPEILKAIKTSRLSQTKGFDASQLALVGPEDAHVAFKSDRDSEASAWVVSMGSTSMTIQTTSRTNAFLVASEIYYPGWEVVIDGKPAPMVQTDYILRGVAIPAGDHTVRFVYKPRAMYYGAVLSGLCLLALIVMAVIGKNPENILFGSKVDRLSS